MSGDELVPPVARRVPTVHRAHGDERVDDYHWLRDHADPEVLAYLEAENAYTQAVMAGTQDLQDTLYQEIVGRIQETDVSAPVRHGPWRYYSRTVQGLQYRLYCRRPADPGRPIAKSRSSSTITLSPRGTTSARWGYARSARTTACSPTR